MKIRGWSIDGFGHFHDWAVSGLPDGLIVLHGANEAGKSTLLAFLQRVIFGAPEDGAGRQYPPLPGYPHRGRIVLANGDGELIVERELDRRPPPALRRTDGTPVDGGALRQLLGGADERLFRTVFACTLDDLHSLAALDVAGVREALFSATLVGAGRSARVAAQALHVQAAERVDGEGAAQVSRLIAELEALRPRLNAARRAALGYVEQRAAAERLGAAVDVQHAALAQRRAARTRDEALLRAWPAWESLQAARAELGALEPVADLPADTEPRLGAARERLGAAQGVARALRAEQAEADDDTPPDPGAAAVSAEVEALHADLSLHRFQLAMLRAARGHCADAEQVLADRVQRVGGEWTVERLRTASRAALDRDAIRHWQERLRAAAEREQQAKWRLETATAACESARRELELAVEEPPAPAAPAGEEVARRRHALGELRAAMAEMHARRRHGEATAETLRGLERALQALDTERTAAPPPAWLPDTLLGVAVASAAAGFLALVGDAPGLVTGALGVVAGATAVARGMVARRGAEAGRAAQLEPARRAARSELEAARRERDAAWRRAAQLAEQIAGLAAALGLPRSPTIAELDAQAQALSAAPPVDAGARAEVGAQVRRARRAELEAIARQRDEEAQARAADVAAATGAHAAATADWVAWRAAAGLPAATFDALLEHVAALDAAVAALAARDAAARELRDVEPVVASWEARARALLARAGAADAADLSGDGLVERVGVLRLALQDDAPQRARRAALASARREREARLIAAEAEVERSRAEVDAVLRAAGARDEGDLARRRALVERRRALLQAAAERERAVAERLGDEALRTELATNTVALWRERAAAADDDIAALEQQVYALVAESHQARGACRALEESSELAALELEWTGLTADLGEAVHDWRVLAAAEGLIDEARQAFERTRQPAVLRAASAAFTAVTSGRYARIEQDEDGQALVVVERGGRRKQPGSELSRGTTEQLYLCLRLGLAQELAGRGVALPLVMDDVLVNFDPLRARSMAEVLGAVARQQQVLFFTCHPSTRDLLMRNARAERLIEL